MLRAIAVQGLGVGFTAVVSFLLLVFLGRVMGPQAFGSYVALLSVAILALIVIDGGWSVRIYRDQVDHGGALGHAPPSLALAVAHVLLASSALAALALLLRNVALGLAFACMGAIALANVVSSRMRGAGRFALEAAWQGGGRLLSALFVVAIVLWLSPEPALIFSAWGLAVALLLALVSRRWLVRPDARGLAASYRGGLLFLTIEGCILLLRRGDMAVLGALRLPAEDLSAYAVGTRFTEAAILVFAPVVNVLQRGLRLDHAAPRAFHRTMWLALGAAAALSATLFGASLLFGEAVVVTLFGDGFRAAGALLPWIIASLPLLLANLVLSQATIAQGRERAGARNLVIGSVLWLVALVGGALLHGPRGAAIGSLLAQTALLALSLRTVIRTMQPVPCTSA